MSYPGTEPYDQGLLDVGDGNRVYWETSGNPDGKPAVVLHGGPGQGTAPRMRAGFDPARYRIVLFDQRGCGRSTPSAADPDTDLSVNTTEHLIADMELLRTHLGIDRWLVSGGSWGSTLALAYAQRHPERVTEIVITAVTTSSRAEIDWLYRGAGRFFPEAWERFRDGVPAAERERVTAAEGALELVAAYDRLLGDPDPDVRARATREWARWEDSLLDWESDGQQPFSGTPDRDLATMIRLCAHYFANLGFVDGDALIRDAHRLAGIPGVLVHGRMDLSGPPDTAWRLANAWPDAELTICAGTGHLASPQRRERLQRAFDEFADRWPLPE